MKVLLFKCCKCQKIFKVPEPSAPSPPEKVKCPECGNPYTESIPSWMPIGLISYEDQPLWEYECQQCQHVFKLPVPSSPSQEEEIRCPRCDGDHIHRLTMFRHEPLHTG